MKDCKIKILGKEYSVVLDNMVVCEENTPGFLHKYQLKIRLDNTTNLQTQHEVFLHEIIEALDYQLELKLEHRNITALSEGLYQVLNDNGYLNFEGGDNMPCDEMKGKKKKKGKK